MEMRMLYTKDDKVCPHCHGDISGHCCGERIIFWCDDCGSNNKEVPPSMSIERRCWC
ncbi:hypothetical protein KAR91_27000 [Candidatus Pacearchaeota archaeon]|nr:hypothetical protein [Candidatus Pacearchaeota archaeon]